VSPCGRKCERLLDCGQPDDLADWLSQTRNTI
jgi:hypothetical protein